MSEQNKKAQDTKVQPKQVRDSQPPGSSAAVAGDGLPQAPEQGAEQAPEQGAEQVAGQAEICDELKVSSAEVAQKAKELEKLEVQLQQADAAGYLRQAQQKEKALKEEKSQLRQAQDEVTKLERKLKDDQLRPARDALKMEKELELKREQLERACTGLRHAQAAAKRDLENAEKKGIQLLAESLLPCVDSLERALNSPLQDGEEALRNGLGSTLAALEKALDKHDIKPYHPKDEDFQPSRHHASATSPAPANQQEPEKEIVLEVLQRGWEMGERVLRFANVIVSEPPQRTAETPMADGESKAERQNNKE